MAKEERDKFSSLIRDYTIFDNLIEGFQIISPDWVYIYVNDAAAEQSNAKKDFILGKTVMEVYPGIEKTELFSKFEKCMNERISVSFENEFTFPEGSKTWFEAKIEPIPEGIIILSTDVTERKKAEESLKSSETQYKSLFSNMTEGFALGEPILDKNGNPVDFRFIEINDAFQKQSGLKREDIIGKPMGQVLPNLEKEWTNRYCRVALTSEEETFTQYNEDTGRYYDVYCYSPNKGQFAIVFQDVTERRKLEESLRKSEEKYRTLFNSIDEGFCIIELIFDADNKPIDYRFLEINPAFENQTGLKNAICKTIKDFVPDIEEYWIQLYGNIALTGEPQRYINYAEGLGRIYEGYAFKIGGEESRKVAIIFNDITDRKEAEEELRKSEAQFQVLVQNLDSGVALVDETGKFDLVNPAFMEIFGLSSELDILNVNSQDWGQWEVYGEDGKLLPVDEHPVRKVAITGKSVKNQLVSVRNPGDDNLKWLLISAEPILDKNNNIKMIICNYYNITEHKKAEKELKQARDHLEEQVQERTKELKNAINELKRSNEELQSFAYITSHDLQEPLRTMGSYAGLLKRRYGEELDSDADEFIDYMVSGSKRMKGMIQGLLDYSRVGTPGKEFKEFNAEEALDHAITNLNSSIEECHAEVTHEFLPNIVADESQITRVFQNLIGNALKFRKEDVKPKIHISVQEKEGEYVFSVADNGIGLEEQYSDRIFEVFKRLHAIGEYEGAGIGLAIVKRIIDSHGGRVWVESEFGVGSTFYFSIPIK
ncbi:PAS domain S-box protein [Methanobacterium sp. ACI-7]|uniref:PAS domain S-box protein n=1 Tax=unclassified Methanobacterium TaxID=2627676 RepID=UPI0039C485AB